MGRDNPRLLVNSRNSGAAEETRSLPPYPLKVTMTRNGDLDPSPWFWPFGGTKFVYCPTQVAGKVRAQPGDLAEVLKVEDVAVLRYIPLCG
jgi:5-amino-6-(5-phosphoribosylamino)uracil reductase